MKIKILILFIFVLGLFISCVNPAATRYSEFSLRDCKDLIINNQNFNEQEKRLYMAMIHYACEFTDEEVKTINDIYKEAGNFLDTRIVDMYRVKGFLFLELHEVIDE